MKLVGIKKSDFTVKDGPDKGKEIHGYNLYGAYDIVKDGEGVAVERVYLTTDKLRSCGFKPVLGMAFHVTYNRFGKPADVIAD